MCVLLSQSRGSKPLSERKRHRSEDRYRVKLNDTL